LGTFFLTLKYLMG